MASNIFNFAPAAAEESLVYGSCGPSASTPETHACTKPVEQPEVDQWVDFMKSQGVTRVVSLLDEEEFQKNYSFDVKEKIRANFKTYENVSLKSPDASKKLVSALEAATAAEEKVVVHCWQGQGRTGQALAAWLVKHQNLSAEEAVEKVLETAAATGAVRKVDAKKLQEFTQ